MGEEQVRLHEHFFLISFSCRCACVRTSASYESIVERFCAHERDDNRKWQLIDIETSHKVSAFNVAQPKIYQQQNKSIRDFGFSSRSSTRTALYSDRIDGMPGKFIVHGRRGCRFYRFSLFRLPIHL